MKYLLRLHKIFGTELIFQEVEWSRVVCLEKKRWSAEKKRWTGGWSSFKHHHRWGVEKKDVFFLLMEGNYMVGSELKNKVLLSPGSDGMGIESTFSFSRSATFHRPANIL